MKLEKIGILYLIILLVKMVKCISMHFSCLDFPILMGSCDFSDSLSPDKCQSSGMVENRSWTVLVSIRLSMNANIPWQEVIFPPWDLNPPLLPIYVAAPHPQRQQRRKPKMCLMKHTLCACKTDHSKLEKDPICEKAL